MSTTNVDEVTVSVGPIRIQTAEDARIAYLREEIDEDELEKILARFGQTKESTSLVVGTGRQESRIDTAFQRTLPEEDPLARTTVDQLVAEVDRKEEERREASKKRTSFQTSVTSDAPIATKKENSPLENEEEKRKASDKEGKEKAEAQEKAQEEAKKVRDAVEKARQSATSKPSTSKFTAKPSTK